ncbi:MAG: tetratricopeptide repeat protein [Flavobacteriaceae bacterium]
MCNKLKITVFSILLLSSFYVQAQNKKVSYKKLESKLETATTDSLKIEALYDFGTYLIQRDNAKSMRYLENGLKLVNKAPKNNYYQHKKAEYFSRMGSVFRIKGNYKKAINNFMLAQKIGLQLKDNALISDMIHNIGVVYRTQGKNLKALGYLKEALEIKKSIKDELSLAISYGELGVNYRKIKQLDSALVCYNKAKEIYIKLKNEEKLFSIKGNMSVLYSSKGELDKALVLAKECSVYHKKQNNKESLCNAYSNIGAFYKKKKDYVSSLKYYNKALMIAEEEEYKHRMMRIYKLKGSLHSLLGNYKEAYNFSKQYKRYSDDIFNNTNEKRIAELEYTFNLQKQQLSFENEKAKLDLKTAAERKEKILYFVLFLVAILSGGLITILIRKNSKQRIAMAMSDLEREQLEKQYLNKELKSKKGDLKKIAVDNKIRQELEKKVLNEVKTIIKLEDEKERRLALKSLNASLLSQVANHESSLEIQEYLNEVDANFKLILDTNDFNLNDKEKNLLCLMKLGLNTNEIKVLQNTTLASLKSMRYRIRKKMGIDSSIDIVSYINEKG